EIGMLANAGAYVSDTIGGTGHVRVTVSPSCIRADFIRAWLPADTLSGIHHNRETAFSYTIGSCSTQGIFATVKIPDILVSPNPANERFTIGLPGNQQLREIVVYNTLGRKLLQSESKTVDVTMLPAGIYFLNIRTSSCITNKKLIISR
ncbi:MAG: T9SS type A sorting domain-containing protein, partial [Bacteroidota bacterium]